MKYPNFVYRKGGQHHCKGGMYQYMSVQSDDELEVAIADGWFMSIDEAMAEAHNEESLDDVPPTREEMEIKARELDLKFDGRTSDRKLLEMINAAISEE